MIVWDNTQSRIGVSLLGKCCNVLIANVKYCLILYIQKISEVNRVLLNLAAQDAYLICGGAHLNSFIISLKCFFGHNLIFDVNLYAIIGDHLGNCTRLFDHIWIALNDSVEQFLGLS